MAQKVKTHCRIVDYIDSNYPPEIGSIIRATCADMTLNTLKGKAGITFIIPSDKSLKEIEKLVYSDKVEDMHLAQDMINAHIMRDVFKNGQSWQKADVPNSLLPAQHVEVKSTTANEVKFANGAVAKLDTNFKDASKRENLAVWKMTSGEIPVTKDKPAKLTFSKMNVKRKTGGYIPSTELSISNRFKIALAVENAYALCQSQVSMFSEHRDVYIETALSLVHYIMQNDQNLLFSRVLPVISFDKMDFYYLVEPHRANGEFLISDEIISSWWQQRDRNKVSACKVISDINMSLENHKDSALLYSGRASILEKIANARQTLNDVIGSQGRRCVDAVADFYTKLEQNNTIEGLGPVYPQGIADYYSANSGLKLVHDELRYITFGEFSKLESRNFDFGRFHEITNMIGEYLYTDNSGDDQSKKARLLNKQSIRFMIFPSEKCSEIKIFVYSTFFMYIPMTKSEADNLKSKYSLKRPDPNNIMVYNISKVLYDKHSRLLNQDGMNFGSYPDVASIIKSALGLDLSSIDSNMREELKKKFS